MITRLAVVRGRVAIFIAVLAISGCGESEDSDEPTGESVAALMCPDASMDPESPFDARTLIGMTVEEATDTAEPHGCSVRVTERDGEPLPATMDLRQDRIDVTVVDGLVTAVALS